MFEAGMRELTLMTRLGHATPDSMKIYTFSRELHQTGERTADLRQLAA